MQELDDNALLRAYVERDSGEAFAAIVARHVNKVYSVALRHTRNPSQAEEITQAVFVILARTSRHLSTRVILSGWLYQTARLTAVTFIRGEIRRARREQEAHMQTALNQNESDAWTQIAPLLDAGMAGLNETDRHAVVLRYFDGKSMREVGTALGANEDAAKKRVNRAVEKLQRFFTKRGIALTGAGLTAAISANSVRAAPVALAKTATAIAVTKGAAAGGSTLALVNGALKLMAWAKVKTVAMAAAWAILALGTTTVAVKVVHAVRASYYPDLQGAWEGVVHWEEAGVAAGEMGSTRLVLKFSKSNGVYRATSDWIDVGRKDVPMGRVVYDFPNLEIEQSRQSRWKLRVNANATEMIWDHAVNFIQPDPVVLRRTDTPDAVPERLSAADFAPRAGSDLQGYWTGAIGPDALPVNFKIAEESDGTFRAEGDNPMRGANGLPVAVTYSRPAVKLSPACGTGMFEGEINGAQTEIKGLWTQGGESAPATLQRENYQAVLAREAAKDYTFSSENDLQGHWKGTWDLPFAGINIKMRFALDIAKMADGSYSAALASLDDFGKDDFVPASDFQYEAPDLSVKWKWSGGAYDGKLKNGKLTGTWQQGGGGFPLVFERQR